MADLAIVETGVLFVEGPIEKDCQAGTVFNAGDMVALDVDGTWKALLAAAGSAAERTGSAKYGMAVGSAKAIGARVSVALPDAYVTVGAFVTQGTFYYASPTGAGKIAPVADVTAAASGTKVTGVCMATSATRVKIMRAWDLLSQKP